jgi:hypothetical protein
MGRSTVAVPLVVTDSRPCAGITALNTNAPVGSLELARTGDVAGVAGGTPGCPANDPL